MVQQFYQRMEAVNQLISNNGLILLPKEGGLEHIAANFPGVADIYQQFQLDIAGAAEYPVSRLFGRTITGLAQTNDADERLYEERIAQDQDNEMRPQLDKLFPVIATSEFGHVPDDMDYTFPSVRVLTEEEKAKLWSDTATGLTALFGSGLMSKVVVLKELKQQADVTGFGTNITDENIEDAQEEEDMKAEMASMGGLGGPQVPKGLLGPAEPGEEGEEGEPGEGEKISVRPPDADKGITPKVLRAKDSEIVDEYDFQGIPVGVEYPAGTQRRLRNPKGRVVYDRLMHFDYGFIKDTVGRDGDEIDVIVGPNPNARNVYVVDMIDRGPDISAREDEDKVLLGFDSPDEAEDAFYTMYPRNFFGGMDTFPARAFRSKWLGISKGRAADALDILDRVYGPELVEDAAQFRESEHPRSSSGSKAGQFVKKGGGGGAAAGKGKGALVAHGPGSGKSQQMMHGKVTGLVPAPADRKKWPKHVKALVIPPAWKDVRFSMDPKAKLLATGVDAAGRKQSRYNPEFRASQDAAKFARVEELDAKFDKVQKQNAKNLKSNDPKTRDHAWCLHLIMSTGMRPGGTGDTRAAKKAYGATTLQGNHVWRYPNGDVLLKFTGKKGVKQTVRIEDRELGNELVRRAKKAGYDGELFDGISDKSLSDYSHSMDGGGFKSKDFRTLLGTRTAMQAMQDGAVKKAPTNLKEYKKACKSIATIVAERLGNTAAVALASYINPAVFAEWRSNIGE
jgi:DNA topoisomerase IB